MSQDGSVSKENDSGLDDWDSISGRRSEFSLHHRVQRSSGPHTARLIPVAFTQTSKGTERESDGSLPPNSEVKNANMSVEAFLHPPCMSSCREG